jgi:transposase
VRLLAATIIVAETNGFETFENIKQLTSYAGLDIRIQESGKWKGKTKISKQGNSHIRKALYMPAISKITHDKTTKLFYERLVEAKKAKMQAVIAVEIKLLGLMFSLWGKKEMYNPDYKKTFGNEEIKVFFPLKQK